VKTIKLNGKKMDVSATEERALKVLLMNDFAAMKSDFWEGSKRHLKSVLPKDSSRASELGIVEIRNDVFWVARLPSIMRSTFALRHPSVSGKRVVTFFGDHPRCESGIFGNVRRVKAILSAIDKGESQ